MARNYHLWTQEELQLVERLGGLVDDAILCKILNIREGTLRQKRARMGIKMHSVDKKRARDIPLLILLPMSSWDEFKTFTEIHGLTALKENTT